MTFRPKNGADDRIIQLALDGTQGIRHIKAKICEAMEVPSTAQVNIYECISSEGATANPLKKRSFRYELSLDTCQTLTGKLQISY